MADVPDHVLKTLEELKAPLAEKLGEIFAGLHLVNILEERYGLSKTDITRLAGDVDEIIFENPATPTPKRPAAVVNIRDDLYLGLEPLDAAKQYLTQVGHALPFDEIADAVEKGGAAVRGADWRGALERSLIRSTAEIVKVRDGVFGHVLFYSPEQLRGLRSTRRQAAAPPKGKRKRGRPPGAKNKKSLLRMRLNTQPDQPPRVVEDAAVRKLETLSADGNGVSLEH